jgi:hypothetical protein
MSYLYTELLAILSHLICTYIYDREMPYCLCVCVGYGDIVLALVDIHFQGVGD